MTREQLRALDRLIALKQQRIRRWLTVPPVRPRGREPRERRADAALPASARVASRATG